MTDIYIPRGTACRLAAFLFLLISNSSFAQITITSPLNNQVFQRNNDGSASIYITAYTASPYSDLRFFLRPIAGNQHAAQEMQPDAAQAGQGFISTTFRAGTGWYALICIGKNELGLADSAIVGRVGVGEVFLVTGNSNAMGIPGLGSKDASENVISFNKVNKFLNTENITVAPDVPMQAPAFEPLKSTQFIYPGGEASWYWAELGDLLYQRWGTPVLFFNAAWAAANSENYRDAATGKDAYNLYVGKFWPNRQPYSNIVNTLRYQTSVTGVRAVLFSHGENDAQLGFNENNYFNNIRTLIENSRADAGYNAPWFIARNSVSNQIPDPYLPVLNAQNRLTELPDFNTFKGPVLDTIQMPRPVSGHFENVAGGGQGLTLAAAAWNRSLSDDVIGNVRPHMPRRRIDTGVVPATVPAGATLQVPYRITGLPFEADLHAELLADSGSYVMNVGVGRTNPLTVTIPAELPQGYYRLRITATNPVVPGSVSERFYVGNAWQLVRGLRAQPANGRIYISWLTAFDPDLRRMVLEKTTDGRQYSDQHTIDNTATTSQVLGFAEEDNGEKVIFYRVRLEFSDGRNSYSPLATLFRDEAQSLGRAFPNPVSGGFFYFRKPENSPVECRLFDTAGREHPIIISDRDAPELLTIRPAYHLPTGTYILQTTSAEQTTSQRIVIQ